MRSSRNVIRSEESTSNPFMWKPVTLDANPAAGLDQMDSDANPLETKKVVTLETFLDNLAQVKTENETAPVARPALPAAFSAPANESGPAVGAPVFLSNQRLLKSSQAGQMARAWVPADFYAAPEVSEDLLEDETASEESSHELEEKIREILDHAEREAQEKVDAILRNAQFMANEIVQTAHSEAAQVTQQAYEKGMDEAQAKATEMLNLAQTVVEEMRLWKELLLSQSEGMVVELVQDIAQKLFGEGMVLDADLLGKAFERALTEAKTLGELRIRAHPEDIKILGPLWSVQETAMAGQRIELIPAKDIQRGSCYIEGQFGTVDARLKTQLHMVSETLSRVLASGSQAGGDVSASVSGKGTAL